MTQNDDLQKAIDALDEHAEVQWTVGKPGCFDALYDYLFRRIEENLAEED